MENHYQSFPIWLWNPWWNTPEFPSLAMEERNSGEFHYKPSLEAIKRGS
jgi:hypothetical protein